nr:hypothetical protein [Tanacetum cinerariifolium]GEY33463.1 hypothetical protein [Tanacetum cinerariifolium]
MAHQQLVADVHLDELCPLNKRYDLMDANKKIDLKHVQCPPERKILTNIIKNHPLRFDITASSSVPLIYMAQFWHTLKEDELLWEGIHYSLLHSTCLIPYPRFTKIIIGHYMTNFPEISRRKYKDKVGIKISDWMITVAMKQTEHYRMYVEVFGIDVPLIQSPSTESTYGTHRTPSALSSPTPKVDATELIVPTRSTVIPLRLPQQKFTHLTPPAPVLTVDKADELILQDTLQVSLANTKVDKSRKLEKMCSIPRNDEHNIPGTRLDPRSDKESLKVEFTDVVIPVNVYDEEEEITDEVYELKRREKRKNVEESRITPFPTPIRSSRIHTDLLSLDTEKLQELTGHYGYLFEHLSAKFMRRKSFVTLADHLHEAMADSLPTMVDKHIKEQIQQQVPEQDRNQVPEQGPSTPSNQEQADDYDFWTDSYASDDDEIPTKQVSQDIMEEVSLNVDEAKLKKIIDEMLRQRCTSGDEHQYHINQMNKFLKSDIVWESRKELLVSPYPKKTTPLILSCQREPRAPALSLINQDLLYLNKENSRPEKIV